VTRKLRLGLGRGGGSRRGECCGKGDQNLFPQQEKGRSQAEAPKTTSRGGGGWAKKSVEKAKTTEYDGYEDFDPPGKYMRVFANVDGGDKVRSPD